MVDFNAEGMLSANKSHILELIILGRRDELINTIQLWTEQRIANTSSVEHTKNKVRSILKAVFFELERTLQRKLDKEKYEEIKQKIMTTNDITNEELEEVFLKINEVLDGLNLIRIDNKKQYDTTNIESENEEKGI